MTDLINTLPAPGPTAALDFSWSPVGGLFTYTLGSTTYVPGDHKTPTNTPITFVRAVTFPDTDDPEGLYAVEYRWDFGDGSFGYGPVVSHTFRVANPHLRVSLRVTDNAGRRYFVSHPLHLYVSSDAVIVVGKPLTVYGDGSSILDGDSAYYL